MHRMNEMTKEEAKKREGAKPDFDARPKKVLPPMALASAATAAVAVGS